MYRKSVPHSAQQALVYILAALSFAFAIYFYLVLAYWPSNFPQDIAYRLANTQAVWFLIPSIPLLLVAALSSFRNTVLAAWISLVSCFVALGFSVSQVCGSAFFVFIPLLLPGGYFSIALPSMLSVITIGYSLHVVRAKRNAQSPVRFLTSRTIAGYIGLGVVAIVVVTTLLYVALELSLRGIAKEAFVMTWEDTSDSRCASEVTLIFAEAPGYNIWTCSADVLAYLSSRPGETVEVQFEREYQLGAWHYRAARIGEWTGPIQLSGPSLYCDSSRSDCSRSPGRLPFRQPYILE